MIMGSKRLDRVDTDQWNENLNSFASQVNEDERNFHTSQKGYGSLFADCRKPIAIAKLVEDNDVGPGSPRTMINKMYQPKENLLSPITQGPSSSKIAEKSTEAKEAIKTAPKSLPNGKKISDSSKRGMIFKFKKHTNKAQKPVFEPDEEDESHDRPSPAAPEAQAVSAPLANKAQTAAKQAQNNISDSSESGNSDSANETSSNSEGELSSSSDEEEQYQAISKPTTEKAVRTQTDSLQQTKETAKDKSVSKTPTSRQQLQIPVKPVQVVDNDALKSQASAQKESAVNDLKIELKAAEKSASSAKNLKRPAESLPTHPAKRKQSSSAPDGSTSRSVNNGDGSKPVQTETSKPTQKGKIIKKKKSKSTRQLKTTSNADKAGECPPTQKQSQNKKTENTIDPQAVEAEQTHSISTPELMDEGNHAGLPKESPRSKDESDGAQSKINEVKRRRSAEASVFMPGLLVASSPDSDTSAEMRDVDELHNQAKKFKRLGDKFRTSTSDDRVKFGEYYMQSSLKFLLWCAARERDKELSRTRISNVYSQTANVLSLAAKRMHECKRTYEHALCCSLEGVATSRALYLMERRLEFDRKVVDSWRPVDTGGGGMREPKDASIQLAEGVKKMQQVFSVWAKVNDAILSLPSTGIACSIGNLSGPSGVLDIPETVRTARQIYKTIQDVGN